jgi:phage baseplate assembly protein W
MAITTRVYKDIDMSFAAHPVTGDVTKKIGDAAIIQSIMNLLSLSKYEKLFQPRIFSNLRRQLFEPVDNITSSAIGTAIRSVIGEFEPRVNLNEVIVVPDFDGQGYNVTMSFFILNNEKPTNITFFLERVR